MIDDATVWFANGKSVDVDAVRFKAGGMIGLRASDGWVYYPRETIARVVPE